MSQIEPTSSLAAPSNMLVDEGVCLSSLNGQEKVIQNAFFWNCKYTADRVLGGFLLVLSSPLTLTLYALVRLTSPGPGFYRQERVGLNGQRFQILKLRSMVVDAEKGGRAVWCVKNDVRVTPIGRVLRRLHLDELPQLWNVARGEMSLVGPRPERPEICDELAEKIDGYYGRVDVKPGVTGLAQINLPPDETFEDVQRKQTLDLHYIENTNVWMEVRILMATAMRVVGIKGEMVMKAMFLCRRNLLQHSEPTTVSENQTVLDSPDHIPEPSFAYSPPTQELAAIGPRRPR